ncbi:MAG: hypothetical protein KDA83_01355 [Planctomycetales bacterium]|nr:hypothetical protein [Planctomycetales bacterium]
MGAAAAAEDLRQRKQPQGEAGWHSQPRSSQAGLLFAGKAQEWTSWPSRRRKRQVSRAQGKRYAGCLAKLQSLGDHL